MKKLSINFFLSLLSLSFLTSIAYALPFTIFPKTGTELPTAIHPDTVVTAYYTVTNNTQSARSGNYVRDLPPNVSQVISNGTYANTCSTRFDLAAYGQLGDSCTLQLTISGPVNANDPDPHHHLMVCFSDGITCAGTNYPLNAPLSTAALTAITVSPDYFRADIGKTQQYSAVGTYADNSSGTLVSALDWNSSSSSIATITSTGFATAIGTGSVAITATKDSVTSAPATMQIKTQVYISESQSDTVLYCGITTVDNNQKLVCNNPPAEAATNLSGPYGIALNHEGTYAYVVNNSSSSVSYCTIKNNGDFEICHSAQATSLNEPFGIALNPAGTYAYITNYRNSTLTHCRINADAYFEKCWVAAPVFNGSITNFNTPTGIAMHPNGKMLYLTNQNNNKVYYCTLNPYTGGVDTCNDTTGSFNQPTGIAIASDGKYAYVTNFGDTTVDYCTIRDDGSFDTCADTGGPFTSPLSIALDPTGSTAYVVNHEDQSLSTCTLVNRTTFSCQPPVSGFSSLLGIVIS